MFFYSPPVFEQKQEIITKLAEFLKKMEAMNISTDKLTLDSFCPWLEQFQWCGSEEFIEVPGQYTGDQRPNINTHTKIFKFAKSVGVFQTLRRPMKITIFGSDAKTYNFVAKSGEDLRQDARIQQLLELMSTQLESDKNSRNHNLSVQTYHVIPISSYCGILSFIEDTASMSEFIVNCFKRKDDEYDTKLKLIRAEFDNFILEPSADLPQKDKSKPMIYGKAAIHYSRKQVKEF